MLNIASAMTTHAQSIPPLRIRRLRARSRAGEARSRGGGGRAVGDGVGYGYAGTVGILTCVFAAGEGIVGEMLVAVAFVATSASEFEI